MRNTFTTFCFTSLCWALSLLYLFGTGVVSRPAHQPLDDYAALYDTVKPVKLAKR